MRHVQLARFWIAWPKCGDVEVEFHGDEVRVAWIGEGSPQTFENKTGKWGGRPYKPCVTHCLRLIQEALAREKKQTAQPAGTARRKDKNSSRREPANPPRLRRFP